MPNLLPDYINCQIKKNYMIILIFPPIILITSLAEPKAFINFKGITKVDLVVTGNHPSILKEATNLLVNSAFKLEWFFYNQKPCYLDGVATKETIDALNWE